MAGEVETQAPKATRSLLLKTGGRLASVRLRIGGWNVAVFTVTLAVFTALGIVAEQRNLAAVSSAGAHAFLAHLAEMPQFRSDRASAESALLPLRNSMHAAGGGVSLVSAGTPVDGHLAAVQPLELREGPYELRLQSDPYWLRNVARRSVLLHLFHGALALGALLLGTEWILRRRLVAPLAHIAHEVDLMTRGWGWRASLPATDRELEGLARAIAKLGPSLASQVEQWVGAERRASAARALQQVRQGLREPLRHAYALLGDLQARELLVPEGVRKARLLLEALDRMKAVVDDEERECCQPWLPAADVDGAVTPAR